MKMPEQQLMVDLHPPIELDLSTLVTPQFVVDVIQSYVRWHNLENHDHGAKLGHNTLTDGLYSRYNLPAIVMVYEWAQENNDLNAQLAAAKALYTLHAALEVLTHNETQNGFDQRAAIARMRSAAIKGDPTWPKFLSLMGAAR